VKPTVDLAFGVLSCIARDPIRMRQQISHPDPFGHPRSHQAELRQVRNDTLVQIQDTALDLL
jgi:hypothetical protein